jgi:hypothetical protein
MLQGRKVSTDFDTALYAFITTQLGESPTVNANGAGVPTVGIGYDLLTESGGKYVINPNLQSDFTGIYTFSADDLKLLSKIAKALNAGNVSQAETDLKNKGALLSFSLSTAQADTLAGIALARDITAANLTAIAASPQLSGTYELIALEDIAYQNPADLTKKFLNLINAGDRLDAWYDILTTMDANKSQATELLRINDANEFGLYSEGSYPVSSTEALAVYRFLDEHKTALLAYFKSHHISSTDAAAFLAASYAPAKTELLDAFGYSNSHLTNILAAPDDKGDKLTLSDKVTAPTLILGGLGADTITDKSTAGENNVIFVRGSGTVVDGKQAADLSDLLDFDGESISGKLTLVKNKATDGYGRTYTYDPHSHLLVIVDGQNDTVSIKGFQQGDFGLTFSHSLTNLITFSEYSVGTEIKKQYKSDGIIFGGSGNGPFISEDGSNPTSPVLSGYPQFNGSITGKFVDPATGKAGTVNEFSLDAGYFDDLHSTKLTWYNSAGKAIGSATDSIIGIQHFDITSATPIAKFKIKEIGTELSGYAIDNVSFNTPAAAGAAASAGLHHLAAHTSLFG